MFLFDIRRRVDPPSPRTGAQPAAQEYRDAITADKLHERSQILANDSGPVLVFSGQRNRNRRAPHVRIRIGEEQQYHPEFVAVLDDGRGPLGPLNLIIEVTGEKKKEKAAKVMTARTLWVPAVNNHGAFGRWGFIEIDDPWDAKTFIRDYVDETNAKAGDKVHD
jgi:hypothetical protein